MWPWLLPLMYAPRRVFAGAPLISLLTPGTDHFEAAATRFKFHPSGTGMLTAALTLPISALIAVSGRRMGRAANLQSAVAVPAAGYLGNLSFRAIDLAVDRRPDQQSRS